MSLETTAVANAMRGEKEFIQVAFPKTGDVELDAIAGALRILQELVPTAGGSWVRVGELIASRGREIIAANERLMQIGNPLSVGSMPPHTISPQTNPQAAPPWPWKTTSGVDQAVSHESQNEYYAKLIEAAGQSTASGAAAAGTMHGLGDILRHGPPG